MSNNSSDLRPHPKYRPDIDGLRAIAVLAVVAFHAFPDYVKGGFIGVDIFFVISGYLISTIIYEGLDGGTFRFSEFYVRRIRRIFPALILVLVTCFVFGWFTLLADEYKQLGKHIAAGAAFVSNIIFWSEAGYFDNAADTKPLLHLWSLGIEEQFYIIWPPLVWLAWKRKYNILTITILLAIVSYVLNIDGIKHDPVTSFYSPQTRFWELLSGGILAWVIHYKNIEFINFLNKCDHYFSEILYRDKRISEGKILPDVLSFIGLFGIVYGFWRINKDLSFPGKWALIPVIGTILIIAVGSNAFVNRKILSNKALVWIGLISFPFYLWHWPLLSFARIIEGKVPSYGVRIFTVLLSIVLAWISYRLIERPIRFGKNGGVKAIALLILMIIVGYVGYNTYERNGLSFRRVVQINSTSASGFDGGLRGIITSECSIALKSKEPHKVGCIFDNREEPKFVVIGDSKAMALYPGLMRTSAPGGRWMLMVGGQGIFIPALMNVALEKRVYLPHSMTFVNYLISQKNIKAVVITSATRVLFGLNSDTTLKDLPNSKNYDIVFKGVYEFIEPLVKAGKEVIIVVDNPTLLDPKDCLQRQPSLLLLNKLFPKQNPEGCNISVSKHLEYSEQYRKLLKELESAFNGRVKIFDTLPYMCDIEKDICSPIKGGRLMYSYSDHISDYAAGLIGYDLNRYLAR